MRWLRRLVGTEELADLLCKLDIRLRRLDLKVATVSDLKQVAQDVKTALTGAQERISADVQALNDKISALPSLSPEDQASLDESVASLRDSVASLSSIDPVPDETSGQPDGPVVEPEQPTDGTSTGNAGGTNL
jgi:hypothetical protein